MGHKHRRSPRSEKNPYSHLTIAQAKFLKAFERCGQVSAAAKACGSHYTSHARWLKSSQAYREAFDEHSKPAAIMTLEDEAIERAVTGWDEPVFYLGQQCGTKRKKSDTLLIFMLKALAPDKYREISAINIAASASGSLPDPEQIQAAIRQAKQDPEFVEFLRQKKVRESQAAFTEGPGSSESDDPSGDEAGDES